MKLEFVVFGISQENSLFLWKALTRCIEFLGFDVTGNVSEVTEIETEDEEWDGYTDQN